jgi:DNA-binding NarL/FixJ family response regulator
VTTPSGKIAPITLSPLALPELVSAGIETMLQPYADRVAFAREAILSCDVALVDPELVPDGVAEHLDRPVIAVTRDDNDAPEELADQLGVTAVIRPSATPCELVSVVEQACDRDAHGAAADRRRLTSREAAVVTMICQGASNSEIAKALFLSPNSVKSYIRTAYRKMGVTTRSQAVLWGVHRGVGRTGWSASESRLGVFQEAETTTS